MRVIFAGTPEFAATALAAIYEAGHEIVLVLTQPDRPAGRGMHKHASAVKQFAVQRHLAIVQPTSLRLDGHYPQEASQTHALLKATPHDVMIVAAYGLILPESILRIPPLGCLNIHASLLPRWRGAAPIHRAIEAGDTETGITIMQMDVGLDTGAMLAMQSIPISDNDNQSTLHNKLAQLGGQLIVDTLQNISERIATPQPKNGITYAAKISKEEAALDFTQAADVLERKIRAFNPFPGAHGVINGVTLKLWEAELADLAELAECPTSVNPGQLLIKNQSLLVACGKGALRLLILQKPGGKKLPAAEFLKGFPLSDKDRFQTAV